MWRFLFSAAAAGAVLGKRAYTKHKKEQELKAKKDNEAIEAINSSRSLLETISRPCWKKSIHAGILPEHQSALAHRLYTEEFLPKHSNGQELLEAHIGIAIRKEICRMISDIDSEYDMAHRRPLISDKEDELKSMLQEDPEAIGRWIRDAFLRAGIQYNHNIDPSALKESIIDLATFSPIFSGLEGNDLCDQILLNNLAIKLKQELFEYDLLLTKEFQLFLEEAYEKSYEAYESHVLKELALRNQENTGRTEAIDLLLDAEEIWDDLLSYCTLWRKNTKSGMQDRLAWNTSFKAEIYSQVGRAIDETSEKLIEKVSKIVIENHLLELAKTYSWEKHNNSPNPRQVLQQNIQSILVKDSLDKKLTNAFSIRLAWNTDLGRRLSSVITEIVIRKHALAYAHEEKLSQSLSGTEYEKLCGRILEEVGWNVTYTKGSNDQGVDIIAQRSSIVLSVQCKRHKSSVGNDAIQAVYAGASYYSATHACVVTTSSFTRSATELAHKTNVILLRTKDLYSIHNKLIPTASDSDIRR